MARTRAVRDRFWLLLLLLPPVLIFPNLGNIFLWQDEAETALLARSVVRHGVPIAHDGRRTISDQPGSPDVNEDGIWIWTPPLQLYLTAASFATFGESNATARLPFALAGWAAILASYGFLRSVVRRIFTARLAVLLLTTSVPFLLQLRQCRYYALVALFSVLFLWGYERMARSQGRGGWMFAAGVGLYYTLAPQLAASTLAVGLDALAVRRDVRLFRRVLAISALTLALTLPYFLYSEGWSRDYLGLGHGYDSLARYAGMLRGYLTAVQLYAWPFFWAPLLLLVARPEWRRRIGLLGSALVGVALIVWPIAVTEPPSPLSFAVSAGLPLLGGGAFLVWLLRRERRDPGGEFVARASSSMALTVVVSLLVHAAWGPTVYFRYLIGILPLLMLATACTLELASARRSWIALALGFLLAWFDLLQRAPFFLGNALQHARGNVYRGLFVQGLPEHWKYGGELANDVTLRMLTQVTNVFPKRYWLDDYVKELIGDYDGPIEATVRYLWEHAEPGDVVLVRYEHYPLMYYTDLTIVRWDEARFLERLPDWILLHGFQHEPLAPRIRAARKRYDRAPVESKDAPWENAPEPHFHRFWTPISGPDVRLLRLREGESHELPAEDAYDEEA